MPVFDASCHFQGRGPLVETCDFDLGEVERWAPKYHGNPPSRSLVAVLYTAHPYASKSVDFDASLSLNIYGVVILALPKGFLHDDKFYAPVPSTNTVDAPVAGPSTVKKVVKKIIKKTVKKTPASVSTPASASSKTKGKLSIAHNPTVTYALCFQWPRRSKASSPLLPILRVLLLLQRRRLHQQARVKARVRPKQRRSRSLKSSKSGRKRSEER